METSALEARQSLKNEQRSEASANEPATLMQEAKAGQAMAADAEPQRHALEEAQARAAALASELAGTRREIETQAAQSQKAVDAATEQKQAAESTIAELRRILYNSSETGPRPWHGISQPCGARWTYALRVGARRTAMSST